MSHFKNKLQKNCLLRFIGLQKQKNAFIYQKLAI